MAGILVKISQQTVWQLIGKLIGTLSTFVWLTFVTRNYGEAGTGVFTLALTFLAFFSFATDLGLNAYFIPDLIKNNLSQTWRRLLGLRILVAGVLTLICIASVFIVPNVDLTFKIMVFVGSLSILENGIFFSASAIFQAKQRFDLYSLIWSITSLITAVAIILLSLMKVELWQLMVGYVSGWMVAAIMSIYFSLRFVDSPAPIFETKFVKEVFKNVWPISLALVLNTLYFRADSFILSYFRGFETVGIYNLAYQIFQGLLVIPAYITNSYYPMMLVMLNQKNPDFMGSLKRVLIMMGIISLVAILGVFLLSDLGIGLMVGQGKFIGSALALKVLALGFPAFFISSVLMWLMVSLKKYQAVFWIYLVGLVVNIILNLVYIPQYGFLAASFVTGVSEYLILLLQIIILWRHFKKI